MVDWSISNMERKEYISFWIYWGEQVGFFKRAIEEYGEVLTFKFVSLVLKNSCSDLIVAFALAAEIRVNFNNLTGKIFYYWIRDLKFNSYRLYQETSCNLDLIIKEYY